MRDDWDTEHHLVIKDAPRLNPDDLYYDVYCSDTRSYLGLVKGVDKAQAIHKASFFWGKSINVLEAACNLSYQSTQTKSSNKKRWKSLKD